MAENSIVLKWNRSGMGSVLAAADADIIGKCIHHNNIDILISEKFYGTEVVSDLQFLEALELATNCNLFGNYTVRIAVDNGFVDTSSVMTIDSIMHAIIVQI